MEVILKDVILSFPNLWKPGDPKTGDDGKIIPGKFGAHGIFAKDSDAGKAALAAFNEVAKQKWGQNWQNVVKALSKDKKCIRLGNQMLDKAGAIRTGYGDKMYIVANNKAKPAIAAHKFFNGKPLIIGEDGQGYQNGTLVDNPGFEIKRPYGGCRVNMKVDIYAMDKPGMGKSINASLLAVQFVGDGTPFGGGAPGTADGFGEEEYDGGAADFGDDTSSSDAFGDDSSGQNNDDLFGG